MGFITIQGENQIAAKQGAGETLNITGFVLANIDGLGIEPVNRVASLPAPADIMDELNVTKFGYVNTNQVVYSLVMDSSIGDYDFNWVGLVDDEGVLIAVTHTPLIQKRATSGGVPGNNLTRNFLIAYSGIQATTAIAVPAETWQIDFNARLHGIDERERLSNFDIYGDSSFLGDGFKIVREGSTTTYNSLAGIGYVGGIRIASAVAQPITVASGPNSIWVDVSLQGDISDMSAVVDFVVSNVAQPNYTDPNGFRHYLAKLGSISAGGVVTDTRESNDDLADHLSAADPHPQYLLKTNTPSLAEAQAGTATTVRAWSAQRIRQAITSIIPNAVDVRQIVLGGPRDGDGRADFIFPGSGLQAVTLGLDSEPLRVTWGDGFYDHGKKDFVAKIDGNLSFGSLVDNAINYLFVDLNPSTGVVTTGSTTVRPVYSFQKPASPTTGQYWYPKDHSSRGEYWNGSVWVPVLRVFCGEVETDSGSVAQEISYAFNGYFEDNSGTTLANSANYNLSANVGAPFIIDSLQLIFNATAEGYVAGTVLDVSSFAGRGTTTAGTGGFNVRSDDAFINTAQIGLASSGLQMMQRNNSGSSSLNYANLDVYSITCRRAF
ncbi:phage tail protein [Methylophaga sp.]|uniref:phage tail-collar fiber domain-containing protein n=1 Tax=Methylophaga sp. TaxID=2024840 RepID=UPI0025F0B9F4|nr:phage tail protein [Methylophaga sp.]